MGHDFPSDLWARGSERSRGISPALWALDAGQAANDHALAPEVAEVLRQALALS